MTALVLCREDINPHLLVCVTAQHTASPRNGSGSKSRLASSCCCLSDLCRAVCARLHVTALPLGAGGAKSQDPLEKAGRGGQWFGNHVLHRLHAGMGEIAEWFPIWCDGSLLCDQFAFTPLFMENGSAPTSGRCQYGRDKTEQPCPCALAAGGHAGYLRVSTLPLNGTLLDFNQVIAASPSELKDTLGQFPCMLTAPITCNRIAWLSAK